MKTIAFAAALALSGIGFHSHAWAQDQPPAGDDSQTDPGMGGDDGATPPPDATGAPAGDSAAPAAASGAPAAVSKKMMAGAEGAVVIPFGDWGDATSVGIGVMGRFDYMVTPRLSVGAHPGFVFGLSKSTSVGTGSVDVSTNELFLTGDVRFYLTPEVAVFADTGLNVWSVKASAGGMSQTESRTRIPLLLGAGYTMASGLTFSAEFVIPNLLLTESNESVQEGVMANVGYVIPI